MLPPTDVRFVQKGGGKTQLEKNRALRVKKTSTAIGLAVILSSLVNRVQKITKAPRDRKRVQECGSGPLALETPKQKSLTTMYITESRKILQHTDRDLGIEAQDGLAEVTTMTALFLTLFESVKDVLDIIHIDRKLHN